MTYDLEDKKNIIYLKNQLVHGDLDQLKDIYSEEEAYAFYLDTLNIALDAEAVFFLLDDSLLTKAAEIMYHKRFEYKDPNINAVTNEIIGRINAIRGVPEGIKNMQLRQYAIWQQQMRETSFSGVPDLLRALAYDAILMEKLYCGDLGETDAIYFFSSTNYLAKVLPEFYQEDQTRIDLTMQRLDDHTKNVGYGIIQKEPLLEMLLKTCKKLKLKKNNNSSFFILFFRRII